MSDHAFDFLQSWIVENINATMYDDKDTAEHLAQDCVWEAETRGITKADLIEAAGGDLDAYIVAELDRAVEREVDRMAPARLPLREVCAPSTRTNKLHSAEATSAEPSVTERYQCQAETQSRGGCQGVEKSLMMFGCSEFGHCAPLLAAGRSSWTSVQGH